MKPMKQNPVALLPDIESRIVTLREQRVILAADLAALYGMPTKALNQAVKRNADKFPAHFMFLLTSTEAEELQRSRSQFVTLKQGQNIKYLPNAFTEHGAIMAATLLNSPRATALSVYVVRAFVELRGMLSSNRELATKVHQLERKVSVHERNIAELVDSMADLLATPPPPSKRPIGFVPQEEKPGKPMAAKGKAAVKKV